MFKSAEAFSAWELKATDFCTLVFKHALMEPGLEDKKLLRAIKLDKIWDLDVLTERLKENTKKELIAIIFYVEF